MLKQTTLALTASAASLALVASAGAVELVDFGFAGAGQIDESMPFDGGNTMVAANVDIVSGLQIGVVDVDDDGTGLFGNNGNNDVNAFSVNGVSETGEPAGLAESIDDQEYVTFTVAAEDGFALDLSDGSLVLQAVGIQGNATRRPDSFALFSSLTGFTADDALDTVTGVGFGSPDVTLDIDDVSALESVTGPVEFRVYAYRSDALGSPTTDDGGFKLDSANGGGVVLNGEVVIPEPASAATLGLLGLAALRRRR